MITPINSSLFKAPVGSEYEQPSPVQPVKNQKIVESIAEAIFEPLRKTLGEWVGTKYILKIDKKQLKKEINSGTKLIDEMMKSGKAMKKELETAGAKLDVYFIKPQNRTDLHAKPIISKKYIVVFNGVRDCSERHIAALQQLAKDTGATVVTFNYRGIQGSTGKANKGQDIVDDGMAVLEHLRKLGIPDQNVAIYGHSMGGGVAALAHQATKHKGSFISENSFSEFSQAVKAKKGRLAAFVLDKLGWNFNGSTAFQAIEKNKAVLVNRRDPTIPYQKSSLYKHLKEKQGPHLKIARIKIGHQPRKETFSKPAVKSGEKTSLQKIFKTKDKKIASDYEKDIKILKKKGLVKYIRHPHNRIMDSALDNTEDPRILELATEDQELIRKFNLKYRKEDKQSYDALVVLFKRFLNISQVHQNPLI